VHRIGRTARAGAEGDAISFACEDYAYYLPDIEAYVGYKIPNEPVPTELFADIKPPVKRPRKKVSARKHTHRKQDEKNKRRRRPHRKTAEHH
jgi:ATP-dependent RNA helicase RhlB